MKLFKLYVLLVSFGMTFAYANVAFSAARVEQAQAPSVYPHNTYTASYVWTQTTVDENTHARESHTHCQIVSSDGKGHLACESPGLIEGIQILDLPGGKLYNKSKYPDHVAKNSITSYSSFSDLNEVMFTHDTDIFENSDPTMFGSAPTPIGSRTINGYQCEGWKQTTDYKIAEWWFDKRSKCLVLMESKPNPNPSINRMIFWLMPIFFGGPGPRTQTITERLDSFNKDLKPPSYFDTKGLSPIKLIVWKMVENEAASNKKPNIDYRK